MTMPPGSDYLDLAEYVGVLRRRWLIVVGLTLAGIMLAAAYYFVAPRVYASTVLIQVNALPTNANALGGRTGGPVNMDNEAQIALSATVGAIARADLKSPLSVSALIRQVHVAVPPNTTFLQLSCNSGTPLAAEQCANAFGRAYLSNRRGSELSLITSGIRGLSAQATALETSIEKMKAKLTGGGLSKSAHGLIQLQLSAKVARLGTIQSKISAVTPLEASLSAKNDFVGQVVTPAVKSARPISPKKKLLLPSGLAGGLVIGLVFAFFWDWRRPRIYQVRDIQRRVDLPMILHPDDMRAGSASAFAPPRSRTGQAFTELAQHLGTELGDGQHVLIVTGTSAGAGGAVAANLASALARSRGETVLICADPNGTAVPRLLGAADGRGFAEVLAGSAALADVTRRTADLPLLRVITPGLDAAGAVYDMQHDKVQRLMRELRREVRYVVIDVPPPSADADTFSLAEFADGAVIVLQAGTDQPADLVDCVQRLRRLRTMVLAAVLLPAGGRERGRSRRERGRGEYPADEPVARRYSPVPPVQPSAHSQPAAHSQPDSYSWPVQAAEPAPPPAPVAPAGPAAPAASPGPAKTQPPYPPAGRHQLGDEAISSSAPVLRPVASRRAAGPSGPAGPAYSERSADPASGSSGFASAWKPRNVSETWPLPRTALTETDEEPGSADPLNGD